MNIKMYIQDIKTFEYIKELAERFNMRYEFFGIYENKKRVSTCAILKDIKSIYQSNGEIKIQTEKTNVYINIENIDGFIISK